MPAQWQDVSSYDPEDPERIPWRFLARVPGVVITITRYPYSDQPEKWYLVNDMLSGPHPLSAASLVAAQAEALALVRARLRESLKALGEEE